MADVAFGSTETVATKADLVAAVVQRELIEAAVVAPRCMNVSNFAVPGAKTIAFPKAGSLTVINRTEGSQGDAAVITYGTDIMNLDFNAYVAWIVDYKSEIQSSIDVQLDLASRAARAHAEYLDNQIVTELEAVGEATSTAGAISYDIIREMRETYRSRNGRMEGSTLLVGPDTESLMLDIAEFKNADAYGASAIVPSGVIGRVLGMDVIVSNKVAASSYYLFDREAIAYGLQAGPSFSEQPANEFGSQAMRSVLDQIFGVKGMFIEQEGAAAGISALVIKDGN
jgi:hypothetical protein